LLSKGVSEWRFYLRKSISFADWLFLSFIPDEKSGQALIRKKEAKKKSRQTRWLRPFCLANASPMCSWLWFGVGWLGFLDFC